MTTRMAHPQHGFTHAYSESEIAHLRKLGWAPETELEKREEVLVANLAQVTAPGPVEPVKRGPGRPRKA